MDTADSFEDLINALVDLEHQFPARFLYHFSDLNPHEKEVLASCWQNVPLQRRKTFMQDLVSLAEIDPILMYEEVAKVALGDSDSEVCILAIDLLFDAEDRRLVPLFLRMLKDPAREESVRAAVANALGPYIYMGELEKLSPQTLQEIEDTLLAVYHDDQSLLVRRRALESLGYSGRDEVPALLRKAVAIGEDLWLESAIFAMGRSADEQWEVNVLENLNHENLSVRIQAVHAAGELALKRARKSLLRAIDTAHDELLWREIIWALAQIGGEGIERKFDALMAITEDEDEIAFLEEAMEMLNFTEGQGDMDLLSVPWEQHEEDDDDEDGVFEDEDDDDYFSDERFNDEEWLRYVDDDDEEDDNDKYSFGEFDGDRFN